MIKTSLFAAVFALAGTSMAHAGGQAGSIGIGAEYQLSGLGGASLNYDAGKFHVGGFLGFDDPAGANNTLFEVGARFFYHVHSTAMSDFSLGGSIGIASVPNPPAGMNPATRDTDVYLEPSFQIRLFIASNVALSFTGGIIIGVIDASSTSITGQAIGGSPFNTGFSGGAGVHYYFF